MDERCNAAIERENLDGDVVLIVASGEIDLETAPGLGAALGESIGKGARHLIVDLTEVTLIDSTGLGALIGAVRWLQPMGGRVHIVCKSSNVRRVFQLTGLMSVVRMYASRDDALAGVPVQT